MCDTFIPNIENLSPDKKERLRKVKAAARKMNRLRKKQEEYFNNLTIDDV